MPAACAALSVAPSKSARASNVAGAMTGINPTPPAGTAVRGREVARPVETLIEHGRMRVEDARDRDDGAGDLVEHAVGEWKHAGVAGAQGR
jgi:hypothetical protein